MSWILPEYSLGSFALLFCLFVATKNHFNKYVTILFIGAVLFFGVVAGSGVVSDFYLNLEKFEKLELEGALEQAKKNLAQYDRILQMDLKQFNNSIELREFAQRHEMMLIKVLSMFLGWILATAVDTIIVIICRIRAART